MENGQAVDPVVETQVEPQVEVQPEEQPQEQIKTFTQEEVDKIVQSRLAREQKQIEEAKKLAKMNADEKAKYELEQKTSALDAREAEINKRELTATAKEILAEKGLPTDLYEVLDYTDATTVNESIASLEKAVQKAVEAKVAERLKGNAPVKGAAAVQETNNFALGAQRNLN